MSNNSKSVVVIAMLALVLGGAVEAGAGPVLFGPAPYGSAADSPFSSSSYSFFFLETFEDGLTTPGVSASGGIVIGSDPHVDSVEGGADGRSWYADGLQRLSFTFDALALGSLPTDVGIVWTDVGYNAPTPYYGPVSFEAFGPGGISLGLLSYFFGDGMDTGQKLEDRFFGVSSPGGVSAIRLSTNNGDWEVDHLQYGARTPVSVPEPSTFMLLLLGAIGLVRSRAAHS